MGGIHRIYQRLMGLSLNYKIPAWMSVILGAGLFITFSYVNFEEQILTEQLWDATLLTQAALTSALIDAESYKELFHDRQIQSSNDAEILAYLTALKGTFDRLWRNFPSTLKVYLYTVDHTAGTISKIASISKEGITITHASKPESVYITQFYPENRYMLRAGDEKDQIALALIRDDQNDAVGAVGIQDVGVAPPTPVTHKRVVFFTILIVVIVLIAFLSSIFLSLRLVLPLKGMVALCNDISKGNLHRRIKISRLDEIGQLEIALNRMAEDLQMYHGKLDGMKQRMIEAEKKSVVTQIAGGVAHEIKNFLLPLEGYIVLLQQAADECSDAQFVKKTKRYFEVISTQVGKIENIARQMKELSKPANGTIDVVDLNKVICETIELLAESASKLKKFIRVDTAQMHTIRPDEHQYVLITSLQENMPAVWADPLAVQQVIMNLIMNAADAVLAKGYGRIEVGSVYYADKKRVCLYVKDTGIGMDENIKDQMFQPFFTTKGKQGTGLGMGIIKTIAERHDAQVEVDSRFGEGTTVSFCLPRQPEIV